MNICLFKDKSYKIVKNAKIINKYLNDIKYIVLDISTFMKGPTHTIVKPKYYNDGEKDVVVKMNVSYSFPDCPGDDITTFKYTLKIDSPNSRYNVYPLMNQMMAFNGFKYDSNIIDSEINIDFIELCFNDLNEEIVIDEDTEEEDISKIFKELKMLTNESTLKKKHIILDKGEWFNTNHIPKKFDYILYNISGIETLYLLSYKEFMILKNINMCTIKMFRKYRYENSLNYADEEVDEDNSLDSTNVNEILEMCLYFPQYIELEKIIYSNTMHLEIELETDYRKYRVYISEKEYRDNYQLSLFDIINKIISM